MRKLFLLLLCLPLAGCFEVSEGDMAGQITYFAKRGYFCKTWEGQIIMGGLRKHTETNLSSDGKSTTTSTSMVANTATFTVERPELVSKIQEAFRLGQPIQLHYKKEFATFCRADSDNTFVQSIN